MSVDALTENCRFDPTPEQIEAKDRADWRALLVAMETEQTVVAEHVEQLTRQLAGLDTRTVATRHDETTVAIARVNIAEQLDHKKSRMINVADAIAAHRKARP